MNEKQELTWEEDDEVSIPFDEMDEQEQYGVIEAAVMTLAEQLETDGAMSELVTAVLFNHFTQRMADMNEREQYETILLSALEDPWEEVKIH